MSRHVKVTVPQLLRAAELREAGLSWAATAVVLRVDEGVEVAGETLRHYAHGRGFLAGRFDNRRSVVGVSKDMRANLP